MSKKFKIQSLDDYLANGGNITKLPPKETDPSVNVFKTASAGAPAVIMSLEEADLFYGESRKGSKPKKPKTSAKIDLDALPEAIRSKFIARMKEEHDGEDYEEITTDETSSGE